MSGKWVVLFFRLCICVFFRMSFGIVCLVGWCVLGISVFFVSVGLVIDFGFFSSFVGGFFVRMWLFCMLLFGLKSIM